MFKYISEIIQNFTQGQRILALMIVVFSIILIVLGPSVINIFDEKDVKNVMNSVISAIGDEGFKMVGNKVVDSFIKKLRGSQEEVSTDTEEPAEETPEETPIEEPETEKLDENFLKGLKTKARVLLKEQLKQEIEKRKRNILIESIKRKIK
jgi:hypothetical protein